MKTEISIFDVPVKYIYNTNYRKKEKNIIRICRRIVHIIYILKILKKKCLKNKQ